ncbi:MAG: DMT family transporter [Candidatus Desulforudis sp.]|nr:DMT family transporter [Desulforudis sp.]
MLNRPGSNSAYLMLFTAPLFWGGAFVAAKYVVPELHPLVAASLRFLISFLVLLPVLLIREKGKAFPAVRDWPLLMLLGLTGVFAYNAFFFYGIGSTAATDGALIVASSPIFTALLSVIFLGERFTGRQVLGFFLSILGVLTIVTKGNPAVLLTWDVNTGDLLFFGCALSWACYSVAGRKTMARVTPLASTTFAIGLGAVLLTVAALPHYSLPVITGLSTAAFWSLMFLGVFASGIAYAFWFTGVHRVGAGRAGVFVNFAPLWAAFWAVLLLGEKPALFHLIGAVLTFSGVYLVTRRLPVIVSKPSGSGARNTHVSHGSCKRV